MSRNKIIITEMNGSRRTHWTKQNYYEFRVNQSGEWIHITNTEDNRIVASYYMPQAIHYFYDVAAEPEPVATPELDAIRGSDQESGPF